MAKGNVRHDCHLELCDTPLCSFGDVLQNRAQGHQNQGQEASKSSLEAPKSTLKSLLGALGVVLGASWRQLGQKAGKITFGGLNLGSKMEPKIIKNRR